MHACGNAIHSVAQAPMSRSPACAPPSKSTPADARSSRADAIRYSLVMGFCFWGMVDEPTWPGVAGSRDLGHLGRLQPDDLGRDRARPWPPIGRAGRRRCSRKRCARDVPGHVAAPRARAGRQ